VTTTVDFDAFRAEQNQEPVKLVIGGKIYDLPAAMPASIAVDLIRMKSSLADDDDVPVDQLDRVGRAVFGADLWETVLGEHRIQVNEIGPLIQMVLAAYSPPDPPAASA
jgi:hypothetical protein